MKTYQRRYMGKKQTVRLRVASYRNNGNLAVQMEYRRHLFSWQSGDVLTVNLTDQEEPDSAYIDTNNLGDEVVTWLEETGLAIPTGWLERSGFCHYPQVVFDRNALKEADPVGYQIHMEQWSERNRLHE